MEIYLLNYLLIIIETIIFQLIPSLKKHKKVFLNIVFIQLFLLLALRKDNVATDLDAYKRVFFEVSNTSWKNLFSSFYWEPLYILLCKLVSSCICNFNVFLIVVAILSLIGPYFFILKYSKNFYLSTIMFVGMYFYSFHFFALRQIIALSILLISIKFADERMLFKFIGLVLIATLFHKSSLLFCIIYPLYNINFSKRNFIIYIFSLIVCLFAKDVITNFVVSIIYSNYSTWVNTDGGYFLFILFIFVMLFTIYLDKYIINEKSKSIYLCFFVAIILQVLAISSNPFARLVLDYYIVLIVMIPNSIMDTKILTEKQKSLLCIGTIIAISIFFI